ncbi:MAG: hypothetical protein RL448_406 [Actinomycetota bacterium]
MELSELKDKWNEILDELEHQDRVAWLTFFDARLAKLTNNLLVLDFTDPEKFSGKHDFVDSRAKFSPILISAIAKITGEKLEVTW